VTPFEAARRLAGSTLADVQPPSSKVESVRGIAADSQREAGLSMDSFSRHEQLLRVFHILDILFSARRPLGIADFKDKLQVRGVIDEMSDKNLRRDLEFLKRFGYSLKSTTIKGSRGAPKRAWSIEPGKGAAELVAPSISLPELLSLVAARDFLAPLAGTMYWRGLSQVLAKMEAVATPSLIDYAASLRDGLVIHPSPPRGKYKSSMLNAINRAISNSVAIELDYTTRSRDEPRRYLIQPEALVVYEGSISIAAYRADISDQTDPRSRALHFFKMDRVSRARPTSRRFSRRRESVASLLADSITLYRSIAEPRRYRIRVSPERVKWACEKPFHPGQKVRPQTDGSVILEIERAWDNEMVPQLLALGNAAEVLEPQDVRSRLAAEARAIVEQYEPGKKRKPARRKPVAK
jgi:predicted DNA-binding transcriptional regulator YafY